MARMLTGRRKAAVVLLCGRSSTYPDCCNVRAVRVQDCKDARSILHTSRMYLECSLAIIEYYKYLRMVYITWFIYGMAHRSFHVWQPTA